MKNTWPRNFKKSIEVLDIGCGIAGYWALFAGTKINLFLIDKDSKDDSIQYGYKKFICSYYNSLDMTFKLLIENKFNREKIHISEATEDNKIAFDTKFDLILSLRSWGFHYPVEIYLDKVKKKISKNGILFLDIRKGTSGKQVIEDHGFRVLEVAADNMKFQRVLFQNVGNGL